MFTLSIIKADTGGFVGHSALHPDMLVVGQPRDRGGRGRPPDRRQVAPCGDDMS